MSTLQSRAGPQSEESEPLLRNRLFACLPPADREAIAQASTTRRMERDDVLIEAGGSVDTMFLPCDAMISVVAVMDDGGVAETGIIGREGAVGGLISAAGERPSYARAVVQIAGDVARVPLPVIDRLKANSPALRDALARFADSFLAQLLQTIACNSHHPLDERLPRWLLAVRDRVDSDELPLTQEYLSEMLGVQRTTVSTCAAGMQQRGMITYARGRILLNDRDALAAASCGCHAAVRRHYDRMLRNWR